MKSNLGFTFLEVLVVTLILGLLIVGIPKTSLFSENKTQDAFISIIAGHLRYARMNSILKNKRFQVKVYVNGFEGSQSAEYVIFAIRGGEEEIVIRNTIPDRYTLYRNINPIPIQEGEYHWSTFHPQGTAGTGTLGLKNEQGRMIQIIISNMGRIRIE